MNNSEQSDLINSVRKDNYWIFINQHGDRLFDKIFTYIGDFSDGIVCVSESGNRFDGQSAVYGAFYYAMDVQGNYIEGIKADLPFIYQEDRLLISWGPKKTLRSLEGEIFAEGEFSTFGEISNGLVALKQDGKTLFWNHRGELIIPPSRLLVRRFKENMAVFEDPDSHKKGYIDKFGKIIIPAIYDDAYDFSERKALVFKGDEAYYINKIGDIMLGPFHNGRSFHEDLAAVKLNNYWKFIDHEGKDLNNLSFDEVMSFSESKAIVSHKGRIKIFHLDGRLVEIDARIATKFVNGLAMAEKNNKLGFIDETGQWIIPAQYERAHDFYKP